MKTDVYSIDPTPKLFLFFSESPTEGSNTPPDKYPQCLKSFLQLKLAKLEKISVAKYERLTFAFSW